MYWNYRFVRYVSDEPEYPEAFVGLKEVYYDGDGAPIGHADPCTFGEDIDGFPLWFAEKVSEAGSLPVLNYPDDFTNRSET